jgi:hypothetical protein
MTTATEETIKVFESIRGTMGEALETAQERAREILDKSLERAAVQTDIRRIKERMSEIEHDTVLDGQIDGKNAETRAAQLARLLAENSEYRSLRQQLLDQEAQLAGLDAVIEYARNVLGIAKLAARWNIAVAQAWGGPDDE